MLGCPLAPSPDRSSHCTFAASQIDWSRSSLTFGLLTLQDYDSCPRLVAVHLFDCATLEIMCSIMPCPTTLCIA